MALVVTERERQNVTEYLQILRGNIESARSLLAGVQKWPWKRKETERLQREIAHDYVVTGIHEFVIGETNACSISFSAALDALAAAEAISPTKHPGYFHAQILAAGLMTVATRRVNDIASQIFSCFDDDFTGGPALRPSDLQGELLTQRGTVTLLGWFAGLDPAIVDRWFPTNDLDLDSQFSLWAKCAKAGSHRDWSGLEAALSQLAVFVAKEVRRGVFKFSEDRYIYLPGMAIVALARRDGGRVSLPADGPWPEELLGLAAATAPPR